MEEVDSIRSSSINMVSRIKEVLETYKDNPDILPDVILHTKMTVKEIQYDSRGVPNYMSIGENYDKNYWTRAIDFVISKIKSSNEYTHLFYQLKETDNDQKIVEEIFADYLKEISTKLLEKSDINQSDLDNLNERLVKTLYDRIGLHQAIVGISGLTVVGIEDIGFNEGDKRIFLRKINVTDIELDLPFGFVSSIMQRSRPSALLHINFFDTLPLTQEQFTTHPQVVNQAIKVLSLFKVGSIRAVSIQWESESFTYFAPNYAPNQPSKSIYNYAQLTEIDTSYLEKFWNSVVEKISSLKSSNTSKTKYVDVAYQRYYSGLNSDFGIEERITFAIMGLEALFLEEKQELSFRFKLRIVRLFSILNYNPLDLKARLSKAYNIRSMYVHGNSLSQARIKNLEEKYADINSGFIIPLFDILRKAILIFTFHGGEKKELIAQLDNSLFDVSLVDELIIYLQNKIPAEIWVNNLNSVN